MERVIEKHTKSPLIEMIRGLFVFDRKKASYEAIIAFSKEYTKLAYPS
jgi:hypothetical protein